MIVDYDNFCSNIVLVCNHHGRLIAKVGVGEFRYRDVHFPFMDFKRRRWCWCQL